MTVATTQGVLNGQSKKNLRHWQAQRRRDPDIQRAQPRQTRVQFERALAQLATAMPDNVKIHGEPVA